MKIISIVLHIISLIAVAILFYLHFSDVKKAEQLKNTITNVKEQQQRSDLPIAYVNIDSLLANYAFYRESQDLLQSKQKQLETNLESRSKKLQEKAAKFQEKVAKHLVTRRQAEEMQTQLMQQEQELMQLKDQFSVQLLDNEQEMNRQIYDSISSFLKDYNKNKNYSLILSNTFGGNLLYGKKSMNVTEDFIEGLNKRYLGENYSKAEEKED